MSAHEIITLQFGNYSNFVGTHYWNFHHKRLLEYDNSTEDNRNYVTKLFRESENSRIQHVPRAMVFDIKTKLKALKQDGSFGDSIEISREVSNYEMNTVVYNEPMIEKNDFVKQVQVGDVDSKAKFVCNFENEVKTWTDFMSYELDDHSVQLLSETYDDGEEFMFFGVGQEEFKQLEGEFEDNLHFWAEECDYLEGFQFITDLNNGYTGLQSKVSEYLADEYKKKSKLNFMNWFNTKKEEPGKPCDIYKYLNIALTLQNMKEYSSLMVFQSTQSEFFGGNSSSSIKIPSVEYQSDLPYHTSGILAATLDCCTIPLYQTNATMSLSELCQHVSYGKWKLAGSSFGLPMMNRSNHQTLFDAFMSSKGFYGDSGLATSLFPIHRNVNMQPTTQLVVLQNLPFERVCPSNIESKVLQGLGLNRNVFHQGHPSSVVEYFNERFYPSQSTVSKVCYSKDRLRKEPPFPAIVIDDENTAQQQERNGVTSLATLFTSPCFYEFLHDTIMTVKKANWHKLHTVQDHGLDSDSMTELVEDLVHIAQAYNHERAFNDMEE